MTPSPPEGQGPRIQPGVRLRCRDAGGNWREKVATSAVEPADLRDERGRRVHDFAGVYVKRPDYEGADGVFWPLEDVELAD